MKRFLLFFTVFLLSSKLCFAVTGSFGEAPDFSFTNQNGTQTSLSDLKGKVWIANFIFTRCQSMCPLLTGKMANLEKKFLNEHIKFISFSVDPEHDTPEVLLNYAKKYPAQKNDWLFLTTKDKNQMWEFISGGFKLGVGEPTSEELAQGAEPVMHSSRFVLVD